MQRRVANLPLHGGKAPPWLFKRMSKLAGAITMAVVDSYGPEEMLRRLADPWWFQAFGCVLGFDWHSSGITTVTCGALRQAQKLFGKDLGIIVAGGKGKTSRKTPEEIATAADKYGITEGEKLVYASRMSAKVDSAAVQDRYQVYHHSFFLTPAGGWCVVQQGMNDARGDARRYHWLGERVDDFVCEPHAHIGDLAASLSGPPPAPDSSELPLLNMVAAEADANRRASTELVTETPDALWLEVQRLTEGPTLFAPAHHAVLPGDINRDHLRKTIILAHEAGPQNFQALLGTPKVGPATIRSLSLLAEVIHGTPVSHRDPAERFAAPAHDEAAPGPQAEGRSGRKWADYSYAHGGKDGYPFPVDRATYDQNIGILLRSVRQARVGATDKSSALRRLARVAPQIEQF